MQIKAKAQRIQQEIVELKGILAKKLESLALYINRIDYLEKNKGTYETLNKLYAIRDSLDELN